MFVTCIYSAIIDIVSGAVSQLQGAKAGELLHLCLCL